VSPAGERLHARDRAVDRVDLGLVDDGDRLLRYGAAQVRREQE
jgi:hypothetical protein